MALIKIFRMGKHVDMRGQTREFTANDLNTTALAYNVSGYHAPLVIGHPKDDQPVLGYVESLASNGGALVANVGRLSGAIVEAVRAGRYKYLSASFYTPHSPGNPCKGVWFLKHVGMLGALPPAVKGLGAVSFTESDGQALLAASAEFACAELWADLHSAPSCSNGDAEFACAPGFFVDPVDLRIHQAALRYQRAHGVQYLDAVSAVGGQQA